MTEKFPGKQKRALPRDVREALLVEDYATRHKRLSELGRKGAKKAQENKEIQKDRKEVAVDAHFIPLQKREEVELPPRDVVNAEGDVVPNPDYFEFQSDT